METTNRPSRPDRLEIFLKRLGRSGRSGRSYGNQALATMYIFLEYTNLFKVAEHSFAGGLQ